MNKQEYAVLRKLLTVSIPADRVAINERERIAREQKNKLSDEDFMVIAESWDAKSEITGRVVVVDYDKWRIVLQTSEWDYILIDAPALRKAEHLVGLVIARALALRKFPGPDHGNLVKVFPNGNTELVQGTTGVLRKAI